MNAWAASVGATRSSSILPGGFPRSALRHVFPLARYHALQLIHSQHRQTLKLKQFLPGCEHARSKRHQPLHTRTFCLFGDVRRLKGGFDTREISAELFAVDRVDSVTEAVKHLREPSQDDQMSMRSIFGAEPTQT